MNMILGRATATCTMLVAACVCAAEPAWTVPVALHGIVDGVFREMRVSFGVADGATDSFDHGIDLPQHPPVLGEWHEALWLFDPDGGAFLQTLRVDVRGAPENPTAEIAWTLVIGTTGLSPDSSFWSLEWNASEVDAAWSELRMTDPTAGLSIDMLTTNVLPIRHGTEALYTIRALPAAPPVRPPVVAEVGNEATVEALVYGSGERIQNATLYYARGGEAVYDWTAFVPGGGDVWTATIPASHVTMAGIMWRAVTSSTTTGVHRTHSLSDAGYIPVVGSADMVLRPTPGSSAIWNVVAPTVWPSATGIAATLDGASGGFIAEWLAWRWDGARQRWEVAAPLGDGTPVATGGFAPAQPWFVAAVGVGDQKRHTPGMTVDPTQRFTVPLQEGWNLLANPFPFRVAWNNQGVAFDVGGQVLALSDAVEAGVTDGALTYLDVGSQTYVTRYPSAASPYGMPPGQGWWLHSDAVGLSLHINPVAAAD